jgi:meso-butanediol dehydrogenase/(S,S)-butanediol dehydrogenase/diacetyl reductase
VNAVKRVALVTGGGSGIGRATAMRLGRDGACVAVCDRDAPAAAAVVEEVEAVGARAIAVVADVTSEAEIEQAVARTVDELGGLDAVASCAGVEVTGTVTSMDMAAWERSLAVNLTGVMLTARHAIPAMIADGGGAFVAISSDLGIQGAPDWLPYAVAKHGVVGLVRCLALDYGPLGVRSNVICPSFVKTPMADRILSGISEEAQRAWERMLPMGRFASSDEIASVVHHLLSREASYTNGLVYSVDGGETAGFYTGDA